MMCIFATFLMHVFMIHNRLFNGEENLCDNVKYTSVYKWKLFHTMLSLLHNIMTSSFIHHLYDTVRHLCDTSTTCATNPPYTFAREKWEITSLKSCISKSINNASPRKALDVIVISIPSHGNFEETSPNTQQVKSFCDFIANHKSTHTHL